MVELEDERGGVRMVKKRLSKGRDDGERKGNCEGMDGDYGGVDEGIKRGT